MACRMGEGENQDIESEKIEDKGISALCQGENGLMEFAPQNPNPRTFGAPFPGRKGEAFGEKEFAGAGNNHLVLL